MNTLGDHIRARRIDLGLFQSAVAEAIGVHELTITNWERNATEPEVQYIPAITRFLGYDPLTSRASFPEHLAAARRARGLTQKQLACELAVDPATLRNWENGQHEPSQKEAGNDRRVPPLREVAPPVSLRAQYLSLSFVQIVFRNGRMEEQLKRRLDLWQNETTA